MPKRNQIVNNFIISLGKQTKQVMKMKGLDTPTSNVQQVQDFDNSRLTNLQMDAVRVLNDAGWKARHISTVLKIPPMKIEYALKVIRGEENKPQPSKDYWEGKVPSIRYSRKDDTEGEL